VKWIKGEIEIGKFVACYLSEMESKNSEFIIDLY
jgi:hypothetical protein